MTDFIKREKKSFEPFSVRIRLSVEERIQQLVQETQCSKNEVINVLLEKGIATLDDI